MSWLAKLAGSGWAKIAALAAAAAALAGAVVFAALRLARAGRDAERAAAAEAALRHQTETAQQTRGSDDALADPASERARRVRRQFERRD